MQVWRPLGRIIERAPETPWSRSHAACPSVLILGAEKLRIFFSTRDAANRSHGACLDLFVSGDRWERSGAVKGPLIAPGPRGAFDGDGVTLGCVIAHEGQLFGYYLGWSLGVSVPFSNFIGLAKSEDAGSTFRRISPAPAIGRGQHTPISLGYPCVIRQGEEWHMWFGSHVHWGPKDMEMLHVVRHARSRNLLDWIVSEQVAVDVAGQTASQEFAISRPWVLAEADGSFSMWYARRFGKYCLGYATSVDGKEWLRRDDQLSFAGAPEPWEIAERTYPCVFDLGANRYMLYNGNGYGREGFGLAMLER